MRNNYIFLILFFLISCGGYQEYFIFNSVGSIKYYWNNITTHQIADSLYQYYPRYINFNVDTSYLPNYPNPFSPSLYRPSAFRLNDTSEIQVALIDEPDEYVIDYYTENNPPGYYLFYFNYNDLQLLKDENLTFQSKLRFTINDSVYVFPLIPKWHLLAHLTFFHQFILALDSQCYIRNII